MPPTIWGFPGFISSPSSGSVYPFGNLMSHVLGFVGVDHKGLAGIERYFDERLRDTEEPERTVASFPSICGCRISCTKS